MNERSPVMVNHTFSAKDFVGGNMVLNFVNTMPGRNARPRDWLRGFKDLVDWAAAAQLMSTASCSRLRRRAHRCTTDAARALESAKELRELLFRVLTKLMTGASPRRSDLDRLQAFWSGSVERHVLRRARGSVQPDRPNVATDVESITDLLVIQAIDLVRSVPTPRLRMCSGPDCAWLFIDSSKAGRRRWCDMAICGNRAKANRFRSNGGTKTRRRIAVSRRGHSKLHAGDA